MRRTTQRGGGARGRSGKASAHREERVLPPLPPGRGHRIRIRIALWMFILVYIAIGARLVRLQVDPDLKFSQEDLKHIGSVEIQRSRGEIYERRGRVLATDRSVYSLSANPSKIEEPDELASALRRRLKLSERVTKRLWQRDSTGNKMKFVWVKRWLSDAEVAVLGDLDALPDGAALTLQREFVRFYPEKELAAHVLGFSNREGVGSEGIELAYDRYLRGLSGRRVSRVDNKRNILGFMTLEYEPPSGGHDVYLTLDASLQFTLERALDRAMLENKAPRAMGILMDPNTGAILALASRPAYDPNNYAEYPAEIRRNRAIVDVFEPGSVFKIVAAAGAIEQGLVTPDAKIDCENGSFNPYGHRIRDVHKLGIEPFSVCFAQSSNIAIIKVGALLGPERMESWIARFGFGAKSNIDLPGESRGIFHPRSNWSRLSMGSLPMGQEIAVTIPQLAVAFSAIANGGYSVTPYLVDRVVSKEGTVEYRRGSPEPRRILSEDTARTMRELCHLVVLGDNTGRDAAIAEYRVGGKTGTAQIAKPDGGGYYRGRQDKYTTVFAGFAPVSRPRIVCVIVVSEPDVVNHFGGKVCGPVFREVVREALVQLNVPPEPMQSPERVVNATHRNDTQPADPDTIVARTEHPILEPTDWEPLYVSSYEEGAPVDASDLAFYEEFGDVLPDLIGLTKREAKEVIVTLGLQWDPHGAGRVTRQEPEAGTPLSEVQVCKLTFSSTPVERVAGAFVQSDES
ncbi:MAG: transpeptidase family protein [Candidatus Hydrogenedentes bacterium]|nr:transpeptidase family protein [Candidatus Hydrogenedentota bacterium]